MAEGSLFVLELDKSTYQANTSPSLSHINVGTGKDITIRELAETMKKVIGFNGDLFFFGITSSLLALYLIIKYFRLQKK